MRTSFLVHVTMPLGAYLDEVVAGIPGPGQGRFAEGRADDVRKVADAAEAARTGRLDRARRELAPFGYDLVELYDPETGGWYAVLRERAPGELCWGTYVVNRSATHPEVQVEVPHPLHDRRTPELGAEAFQLLDASVLMIAGAYRYLNGEPAPGEAGEGIASDMARNDSSLFMEIHRRFSAPGGWVLQYHGFGRNDDREDYPQVVVSNGSQQPGPELHRLRRELERRGLSAGVFDGRAWTDLGGTCNPQGKFTRAHGGRFLHLEHASEVRVDRAMRSAAVAAAHALVTGQHGGPPQPRRGSDGSG